MLERSELRVTGSKGESEIDLGTIITSTHRVTHITLVVHNTSHQSIVISFHLSKALAEIFSISSVRDLNPDRPYQHQTTIPASDPCLALNRNLVHDCVREDATLKIPGDARRLCRLSLTDLSVTSLQAGTPKLSQKACALRKIDGNILIRNFNNSVQLKAFRVRSTVCESWIRPDLELLDFGQCPLGVGVYRDITIRNLSQVPARCCFSHSFRLALETENVLELSFIDPELGFELDPKIIHIEPSAMRCIRVAFRTIVPIQHDQWLCLQNLDNSEDFWHLRVVAKVGAERIAQLLFVSCGAELDFGDCYLNCQTFRDVIIQSSYKEDVTLTLMTDRPKEVTFEILNDWAMEEATDTSKKTRLRTNTESNSSNWFPNEAYETRPAKRQPSFLVENSSDQETVSSHTNSIKYFGTQPTDRDECADTHKDIKKRSRLPESVLIRPGQKKGIRVWYLPVTTVRKRLSDPKEINDFDPGALQDDTFLLTFKLSSGENRTIVGQSQVCESVVRLERNEIHLGNCNVMTRYRGLLSLINCSDLPAFVSMNYVSQCVFADTDEFQILPRETYDLGLEFIPRQVNSGYHKEVTVSNLRNPKAPNLVFTLTANCVDDQGISLHALFYKLLAPNPTNEIDFGVTVANHPAIRAIKVRNVTDKRLILELEKCPNVTTYLPSGTSIEAARYERKRSPHHNMVTKCVCQSKSMPTSLVTKASGLDSGSHNTTNALVDMDISRPHLEPGSAERQNLPIWQFESCLANLQQYCNASDSFVLASAAKIATPQNNKPQRRARSGKQSCWVDFFSSTSEGKVTMLDSMPTLFSNYDSEIRYTEQQFRPEQDLRAAVRVGCLMESTTLVLEQRSESVVVLSLKLNDKDVREKTKIRPIERHLSIRMVDFDRSRLIDLPETSSKQMLHIAKLFEKGDASRPREVLLTVQACKSRMSIAPLRQLNFGTITCGEQKDKAFSIVNLSEAPLLYEIRKTGVGTRDDIRFNLGRGTQGVVRPYFTKIVPFIFAPSCDGKYEERIIVENRLDRTASSGLTVKAHIRSREDLPR